MCKKNNTNNKYLLVFSPPSNSTTKLTRSTQRKAREREKEREKEKEEDEEERINGDDDDENENCADTTSATNRIEDEKNDYGTKCSFFEEVNARNSN